MKHYTIRRAERAKEEEDVTPSVGKALFEFVVLGLGGLFLIYYVVVGLGTIWTFYAASLIASGVFLGAATTVFGAMLELLVHVGNSLVQPLHLVASWFVRRWILAALLGFFCLSSVAAQAEGCSYQVKITSETFRISIDGKDYANRDKDFLPPVRPFERVEVKDKGTSLTLQPVGGTEDFKLPQEGAHFPAVLIVPPCSPRPGISGAWDAFWGALNTEKPGNRSAGASPIYRGQEKGSQATGGALRELSNLASATGVVSGTLGLAFAWAGGNAPYHVAIQDEANGASLGAADVAKPSLWLPEWRTPAQPFVIIVRDAKGAELSRHLRPLPPIQPGEAELGDAIQLFETMPAYRLEALRRLVARANDGDALAGRAVALLQYSGASE